MMCLHEDVWITLAAILRTLILWAEILLAVFVQFNLNLILALTHAHPDGVLIENGVLNFATMF